MAITTPALGGTTLPQIHYKGGFIEYPGYRGADMEMASGAMATDLVSSDEKKRFELYWIGLTESDVATVRTAFATVRDGSANFTSPLGNKSAGVPFVVTRDYGAMELEVTWYRGGGVARADVRMRLREV